jgi:hypothetical protein
VTDSVENQLIADLARDLVLQTAPQELTIFRAHSKAFFENPDKLLAEQGGKDEPLGFGVGEVVAFMTPAILAMSSAIIQFLVAEIKTSAKDEGTVLIGTTIKQVFKKFRPAEKKADQPPPLTAAQLAHVRELVLEKANQLKLSEARRTLMADALIGSLAVASA